MPEDKYIADAAADRPAYVIFVVDTSGSMNQPIAIASEGTSASKTRLEVVSEALRQTLTYFKDQSSKTGPVRPKYEVAILSYSRAVTVVLPRTPISQSAAQSSPPLTPQEATNTRGAFEAARALLEEAIPTYNKRSPAPLICHLTDGEYNVPDEGPTGDPSNVAEDIRGMLVPDGFVLISNIFVSDSILTETEKQAIRNVQSWPGITNRSQLVVSPPKLARFAETLYNMSSVLPESYRKAINDNGYNVSSGARMLFPGDSAEMVKLGFAVAGATGTGGLG